MVARSITVPRKTDTAERPAASGLADAHPNAIQWTSPLARWALQRRAQGAHGPGGQQLAVPQTD